MNDDIIIQVYRSMVIAQKCTVDDILISPDLRVHFVTNICEHNPTLTEKYILQRLVYLRKKGRLPRSRALLPIRVSPK